MRVFISRSTLLVVLALSTAAVGSTGCRSGWGVPGASWLGMGQKKPSPTAFASNRPQPPSATTSPYPTYGGGGSAPAYPAYTASNPPYGASAGGTANPSYPSYGNSVYGQQAGSTQAGPFYTGQYSTSSYTSTMNSTAGGMNTAAAAPQQGGYSPQYPPSGYTGNYTANPSTAYAGGADNGYRTADTRNASGAAAMGTSSNYGSGGTAGAGYNSDAYAGSATRQSAYSGASPYDAAGATQPQGGSTYDPRTPTGSYPQPSAQGSGGYGTTNGYGTPSGYTAPSNSTPYDAQGQGYDSGAGGYRGYESTPSSSPSSEAYRPGSTRGASLGGSSSSDVQQANYTSRDSRYSPYQPAPAGCSQCNSPTCPGCGPAAGTPNSGGAYPQSGATYYR